MQGMRARSLVGELGSHMPLGQEAKMWNRGNIVTNSIKTLKMVRIRASLVAQWLRILLPMQGTWV